MLTCCIRKKLKSSRKNSLETQNELANAVGQEKPSSNPINPISETKQNEGENRKMSSISLNSFYSIKSSRSESDGADYYSVCSVDSYKSV
ncbi:unnamed protein product [Phyllotreta striolata]|uniref:Uncharacterized protein n=1 Tax=Phyllotreta striolata TaxID=444603 RepID=A0A9N9TW60_PHYSR|nr:unnamed protein product [Phyllotreta striolata]